MKKIVFLCFSLFCLVLCGCSKASMVSYNLSRKSNYFEVPRRIIFYNGITNEYILQVEGYCSLGGGEQSNPSEIWIVCKDGDGYKKHFLGLSDNVTYIVEQIDSFGVSENHYNVIFKPSSVLPTFEIK